MNKTQKIYNELLLDLLEMQYAQNKNISREYECKNGIKIIYSIAAGPRTRIISISVDSSVKNIIFPSWQGVSVNIVIIPEYDTNDQLFLELSQSPDTEAYIFEIVAEDLRRGLETLPDGKHTVSAIVNILKKWAAFFKQGKKPVLSSLSAQGLYGELLFLKELISSTGAQYVGSWESVKNTHDYYIGQNAVEIKTCSVQNPYKAHISSEHQLDRGDVNGRLFLRLYALRKDHNGGQRLPEIIEEIRKLLQNDEAALKKFNSKIFKLGYFDSAEDYYTEGYTIRETYSFEIKEGFPCISMKNIPRSVSNVEYDLIVNQCMDYIIDADELMKGVKS